MRLTCRAAALLEQRADGGRHVVLRTPGARHMIFSDEEVVLAAGDSVRTVNAFDALRTVRIYTRAFFDRTLKGRPTLRSTVHQRRAPPMSRSNHTPRQAGEIGARRTARLLTTLRRCVVGDPMRYFTTPTGIALFIFVLNLPFGAWRARLRKLSPAWFVAIHLPVVLAIGLRILIGVPFRLVTLPLYVLAFFFGQLVGALVRGPVETTR